MYLDEDAQALVYRPEEAPIVAVYITSGLYDHLSMGTARVLLSGQ